jgi:plasmid stabilization system protein ParE
MAEGITAADAVGEIEQYAAILAVETTPANAAEELRRIADELEALSDEREWGKPQARAQAN